MPVCKKNVDKNFVSDKKTGIFAADCVRKP